MHIYKEECRHAPEIGICTGAWATLGAGWRGRVRAWQDRGLAVRLPHSALEKSGTAPRASELNTFLTYFSFRGPTIGCTIVAAVTGFHLRQGECGAFPRAHCRMHNPAMGQ